MTGNAVGRVNRRFLLLALILAGLSAVLAYTALSSSGGDGSTTTDQIQIVVAKVPIPASTRITAEMVELADFPESRVSAQSLQDLNLVIGQVTRYELVPQEAIFSSKLVNTSVAAGNSALSYVVETGQRGMAISVAAVTQAGGLLLPGDHVDVLWVPEKVDEDLVGAGLIAENVEVLAVQQTIVDLPASAPGVQNPEATPVAATDDRVRASDAPAIPEAATVTLLLTPDQAARVFCAEAGGGAIRLAVRAFGDDSPSNIVQGVCILHPEEQ
jgi:pilus assembly protein CpaB